jgi:uncharacterized DUF497 family protein
MTEIEFEWDPRKDRVNQAKHGVSFSEAVTAFYDENGYLLDDPDHSDEEDHFVLLGLSATLRLLVVVHCFRGHDATIRIVSARRANPSETAVYDRELGP